MASDVWSAQHTADVGSLAFAASAVSASPVVGATSSSALEAAIDGGDGEPSGGWDSDSDAGYQSAEDWPASPQSAGRAPADVGSPAPLRSAARQRVGLPSAEAGTAASPADDDEQPASGGALADVAVPRILCRSNWPQGQHTRRVACVAMVASLLLHVLVCCDSVPDSKKFQSELLLTHSRAHAGALALESKFQSPDEQHDHDGADVLPPTQLSADGGAQSAGTAATPQVSLQSPHHAGLRGRVAYMCGSAQHEPAQDDQTCPPLHTATMQVVIVTPSAEVHCVLNTETLQRPTAVRLQSRGLPPIMHDSLSLTLDPSSTLV